MSEHEGHRPDDAAEEQDLAPDEQAEEDVRGGILPPDGRPGITPPDT